MKIKGIIELDNGFYINHTTQRLKNHLEDYKTIFSFVSKTKETILKTKRQLLVIYLIEIVFMFIHKAVVIPCY